MCTHTITSVLPLKCANSRATLATGAHVAQEQAAAAAAAAAAAIAAAAIADAEAEGVADSACGDTILAKEENAESKEGNAERKEERKGVPPSTTPAPPAPPASVSGASQAEEEEEGGRELLRHHITVGGVMKFQMLSIPDAPKMMGLLCLCIS